MDNIIEIGARGAVFALGSYLVVWTVMSAVRTFVLARSDNAPLTRRVFITFGNLFRWYLWVTGAGYDSPRRDRVMAYFAPLTLLSLPLIWLMLVMIGYTGIFWAISAELDWREALVMSGSSLMTLGFKFQNEADVILVAFTEAALGMMLVALLIGYLPTMYNAFSTRELQVTRLEVRAGSPPSATEFLRRLELTGILYDEGRMWDLWETWEQWFSFLEESHSVLAPLNFFRSPSPSRHWVSAAGTVLDTASLVASTVDIPRNRRAAMTVRAGFVALRAIADFFPIPYDPNPQQGDPISITRQEFDTAYDTLVEYGIPMLPDRDQCWKDFSGWRVNYDNVLRRLANITMAPSAPWSTDRPLYAFAPLDVPPRENRSNRDDNANS